MFLLVNCAPSREEVQERSAIVSHLQTYIRQWYKGAYLQLFGSSANGFGFGHSDLDICLMFENHPTGEVCLET